LILNWYEECV